MEDQLEQPFLARDNPPRYGSQLAAPDHMRDRLGAALFLALACPGHLGQAVHRGGRDLIDMRREVEPERPAQASRP